MKLGPGIDPEKLAGAEDGVEDCGTVAGIGMAVKKPVFQAELTWTNLPLGRIIIDQEMTVARVGETGEFGPAGQSVADCQHPCAEVILGTYSEVIVDTCAKTTQVATWKTNRFRALSARGPESQSGSSRYSALGYSLTSINGIPRTRALIVDAPLAISKQEL